MLKQWHGGSDRRLSRWSWVQGRLHHKRCSAKGNAVATGLYGLKGGSQPNLIEQEFFQTLDSNAAKVHQRLVNGTFGLNTDDRIAWSQFLVSLMVRTPDKVAEIRRKGAQEFDEEAARDPDEYSKLAGDDDPQSLNEWVKQNAPTVFDDIGVATLPSIVTSEVLNLPILSAQWQVRRVGSSASFLIADRPLVYVGTMAKSFLLALPLNPSCVFLAFNNSDTRRRVANLTPLRFSKDFNKSSVGNALQYVYAADESHRALIEKRLKRP